VRYLRLWRRTGRAMKMKKKMRRKMGQQAESLVRGVVKRAGHRHREEEGQGQGQGL